ncbi:hypothetical protein OnM2_067040 [Erysiphe neolycopersici]|uniref:Uncharacterized protein n=1 Tax=Erysiphe neolycopersici TaxID=212602 RepID=A0A420HMA0_9PEZI|nr:hypothetical protein OnM2_067040 [Erysiphe neolycopersici]
MSEHLNGSNTLPRDFRFRYHDSLTTPEPLSSTELYPPSPPRQRLKVRRRIASKLLAPTKQFLASVEAADIPLPTIEYTKPSGNLYQFDETNEYETESFISRRRVSTPKTPALVPSFKKIELRPDWYKDEIQKDCLARPCSSYSTSSDVSNESSYSNGQSGFISEDGSCTSPDSECLDPFHYSSLKVNEYESIQQMKSEESTVIKLNSNIRKKAHNSAPWSKAQITHLWATYILYLQDPTVTPFRIGASRIPPEGVCHRVAREARRSWKGPSSVYSRSSLMQSNSESESESNTLIEKNPKTYIQWPHSSSATRNKLRSICRHRDPSALYRFHKYLQSRSPTPFSKSTPCRVSQNLASDTHEGCLNIQDISISLSLSTSESMRPDGILAGLAQDDTRKNNQPSNLFMPRRHSEARTNLHGVGYRLGSPFSRTYGPSSSRMNEQMTLPFSRNLGSPLQFSKVRSLNGIQRRRAQLLLREEYIPKSLIFQFNKNNDQYFDSQNDSSHSRMRGFSLGEETRTTQALHSALDLLPPPTFNRTWPHRLRSHKSGNFHPPRLMSPFVETITSEKSPCLDAVKSKSTRNNTLTIPLHQLHQSKESYDFGVELKNSRCEFSEEST